jgi:hypothetical protein
MLPVATLSGTTSYTPGSVNTGRGGRGIALVSAEHREQRFGRRDGSGDRGVASGEQEDSKIEQRSRAGPFAGPKPELMTVPRGAGRSDQTGHSSRLEQARRFLPSWPCEFDSRHPLHSESPSQWGDRSANVSRSLRNPGIMGH